MPPKSKQPSLNAYYIHETLTSSPIVRDLLKNSRRGKAAERMANEMRRSHEQKPDQESQRLLIMAECERLSVAFYEFVDLVLDCEMLAAGFHYHRGEWRKRRVPKEERSVDENVRASGSSPQRAEPKRSRTQSKPRRRSVPVRRSLDCRLGLVRGMVGFRSAKARTIAARKATIRKRSLNRPRCHAPLTACDARPRARRTACVGRSQLPRPPPVGSVISRPYGRAALTQTWYSVD